MSEHHQPIFLSERALKALRLAFDQDEADAARARAAGAHRERDEVGAHARGDEGLRAVDDVMIAVAPRGRAEIRDIGAAAGLGDRERRDFLAREDLRQHARLHLLRAAMQDRRRADRVAEEARRHAAAAGARDLLHRDDAHEAVALGPAVALRESRAPCSRPRPPCCRARAGTRRPRPIGWRKARSRARRSGAGVCRNASCSAP